MVRPERLQPGSILYAQNSAGKFLPVRLSVLFNSENHGSKIYGLLAGEDNLFEITREHPKILTQPRADAAVVGEIKNIDNILPNDNTVKSLFSVFELNGFAGGLVELAYSQDLSTNIYRKYPMRVSRVPVRIGQIGRHKSNQTRVSHGPKGCLTADLSETEIELDGKKVFFAHAGLAESFGSRALVRPGDSGAPLLSASKALVGFVVGASGDEALILPAEDVANKNGIRFLAPRYESFVRPKRSARLVAA
jgi:hypothetical protein